MGNISKQTDCKISNLKISVLDPDSNQTRNFQGWMVAWNWGWFSLELFSRISKSNSDRLTQNKTVDFTDMFLSDASMYYLGQKYFIWLVGNSNLKTRQFIWVYLRSNTVNITRNFLGFIRLKLDTWTLQKTSLFMVFRRECFFRLRNIVKSHYRYLAKYSYLNEIWLGVDTLVIPELGYLWLEENVKKFRWSLKSDGSKMTQNGLFLSF